MTLPMSIIEPEQFSDFRGIFDCINLRIAALYQERYAVWNDIRLAELPSESEIKTKYMQPFLTTLIGPREISFFMLPAPVRQVMLPRILYKYIVYKKIVLDP